MVTCDLNIVLTENHEKERRMKEIEHHFVWKKTAEFTN